MADPPQYPGTDDVAGRGPDHEPPVGTPRWVKVFGVLALVLLSVLVVLLLMGGHGPGRHMSGGMGGAAPPSASVTG